MRVFIGMSAHTCMSIYVYIVFLKNKLCRNLLFNVTIAYLYLKTIK
jgi:hypothetical protein